MIAKKCQNKDQRRTRIMLAIAILPLSAPLCAVLPKLKIRLGKADMHGPYDRCMAQ